MTHPAQLRSLDFFDPDTPHPAVDLIGLGGIGSFTAHAIARLGVNRLGLHDPDTVAEHNIGCQAYAWPDVGELKTDRTARVIETIAPYCDVATVPSKIQGRPDLAHNQSVVIAAVDNMATRTELFNDLYLSPHTPLYIDARIAGQLVHVHAFDPTNLTHADKYRTSLHSDAEAIEAPCTAQNVIDVGYQVASLIVRVLRARLAPNDSPPANFISLNQETLHMTTMSYDNPDLIFS
jgi:molybdopterin/thiamine biosynthesis adenylyltransferase